MTKKKKPKKITVQICKDTLRPLTEIPFQKHHTFYWYLSMIIFGRAYERGDLPDIREAAWSHMMKVHAEDLSSNSWEKTVKTQFENAYASTMRGDNNWFPFIKDNFEDVYQFEI